MSARAKRVFHEMQAKESRYGFEANKATTIGLKRVLRAASLKAFIGGMKKNFDSSKQSKRKASRMATDKSKTREGAESVEAVALSKYHEYDYNARCYDHGSNFYTQADAYTVGFEDGSKYTASLLADSTPTECVDKGPFTMSRYATREDLYQAMHDRIDAFEAEVARLKGEK